jgi:hypothetical protein
VKKMIAALASLAFVALCAAGCVVHIPHMSAAPEWTDTPCATCMKASCRPVVNVCLVNPDCRRMFIWVGTEKGLRGPATLRGAQKITDVLSCWDAHCAEVCPRGHGATT